MNRGLFVQTVMFWPLAILTVALLAFGWWIVAIPVGVAAAVAGFWVRKAVVDEKIDEALQASGQYDNGNTGGEVDGK